MMLFCGIDPGKSGGIAWIEPGAGGAVYCEKLADKTEKDVWLLLSSLEPAFVVIEKVHAGPRMGSSAAFKFGSSCGGLLMAAICAGLPTALVTPQKWQRDFGLIVQGRGLGQDDTAKKNRNKAKAQELFPGMKVTHAIADALLLAKYCKRNAEDLF